MAKWYEDYGSWIVGTLPFLGLVAFLAFLVTALLRRFSSRQIHYWIVFTVVLLCFVSATFLYGEIQSRS